MTKPLNNTAWNQDILEQSVTAKETVGALRFTEKGQAYRYAKAGEALSPGKWCQSPDATANHIKLTAPVAAAGASRIGVTVGATLVTEDQYAGGYLQIYDGTTPGIGIQYGIKGNTACIASGVTYLDLETPLLYALTAADTISLIPNECLGVTQNASLAHGGAGVVPRPVTSGYYFWVQIGGMACALNGGGTTLGAGMVPSATEGALKTQPDGVLDSAPIGFAASYAGVDTKYCPVMLTID